MKRNVRSLHDAKRVLYIAKTLYTNNVTAKTKVAVQEKGPARKI